MRSWRIALGAVVVMIALSLTPLLVHAGAVALPQTGITKCLDGAGLEIPCMGTGQDGDLRTGAAWPAPRFTDSNDGTLLDNLTGLSWPVDAGTPAAGSCMGGAKDWQGALDYVACLNSTGYLGRTDWRLPNINELESLLNSAYEDSRPWLSSQGFMNVGASYWSSTTASTGSGVWSLAVSLTYPKIATKTTTILVWPVRMSSAGISQVWKTGQTMSFAAGDDGALQMGAAWPSPRFNPNSDGTVTDRLTGLRWPQDASTPTIGACTGGMLTWTRALNYVACLNTFGYLGHNDWRLPNRKELMSLINYSHVAPALVSEATNTFYFSRLSSVSNYYWSGSPDTGWTGSGGKAWQLAIIDGYSYPGGMSYGLAVWPVRGASTVSQGPMTSLSPAPYSFGYVHVGTSAPVELTLSNTGTQDLIISSITITGSVFSIAPGGAAPCESLTPTLAPGGSCTLAATFSPTSVGYASATMVIISNDPETPILISMLSGTGIDTYQLTVTTAGTGWGYVVSNPQGITCMGSDPNGCSAPFVEGALVTLTPNPRSDSAFTGWSGGGCSGTGPCTVTMNADTAVTATFNQLSIPPTISLSPASYSFGAVLIGSTSYPAQLTLKNSGTADLVVSGITVTSPLFAVAPGGSAPCASLTPTIAPGGSCTLAATFSPTSSAYSTTTVMIASNDPATPTLYATLSGAGGYLLSVSVTGTGWGYVVSNPQGITCVGSDPNGCSAPFAEGALVTLTPNTTSNSAFAGWSGGGCSGTGPCTVTVNGPTNVTATFDYVGAPPTISLSPTSVSFGATPIGGTSWPAQLTLSNSGNFDLIVSGITVTSPLFTVAPGGSAPCASLTPTIAPGGSCTLAATFSPTSSAYSTTTVMIASNDPAKPTVSATLSGTGGYQLMVSTAGTGTGFVSSSPNPVISCPNNCSWTYTEGTVVTLTAWPVTGSVFAGWSGGGCSGTGTCTVTMNAHANVTATFGLGGLPPKIALSPASPSFGTVSVGSTSAPVLLTLSNSGNFDLVVSGITVTSSQFTVAPGGTAPCASLTPTIAPGSICTLAATFAPTSGGPQTGYLTIMSNDPAKPTLYAQLSGTGAYTLSVLKTGTGGGTVSSSPAGISCGSDCTEPYPGGATVTLTATPDAYSVFAGWTVSGGGACTGTGPCTVMMTSDTSVHAQFAVPIIVTAPNGGETIRKGSTYTIAWNYDASVGSFVRIELLKGGVLNKVITASAPIGNGGAGSYSWNIPKNQTLGSDYKIRITSTSNSVFTDTSDGYFSITK